MSDVVKGQRSSVNIEDFERKLYASSNSGPAVDDPLAELSRLVGKADPFGNVFANAATGTRAVPSQPSPPAPPAPPVSAPVPPPIARPVPRPEVSVRPAVAATPPSGGISVGAGVASRADSSPRPNFSFRDSAPFPRHAAAAPDNDQALGPNFFDRTTPSPSTDRDEAEFFSYLSNNSDDHAPADYLQPQEIITAAQPRTGRLVLVGILIVSAIGAGAMLGLRGIDKKSADGSIPVIKAEQTPVKVEPAISDADKAKLDEEAAAAKDSAANVTTKQEQPVEVVTPPGSPPIKIARMIPLSGSQARPGDVPAPDATPGAPVPANGFPEPHTVKTVSVRPDGSIISGDKSAGRGQSGNGQGGNGQGVNVQVADSGAAPPLVEDNVPAKVPVPQSRPSLPQAATPSHVPAATGASTDLIAKTIKTTTPKTTTRATPTATSAPQDSNAPLQLTPVEPAAPANPPPVKIASAQPAPAAPAAAAAGDGFAVQLGVAGSEEDAKALSAKMASQFGSVLGSYRPSVHKSDVNGKTVFRVRVVNLAKEDAVALCEKLRGSGGQCFVAH